MADYRRWFVAGGMYFFTAVTHERRPIFRDERAVHMLGEEMRRVGARYPFRTVAIVLLPDHLHCVWSVPCGDDRFPLRLQQIKGQFSERWLAGVRRRNLRRGMPRASVVFGNDAIGSI